MWVENPQDSLQESQKRDGMCGDITARLDGYLLLSVGFVWKLRAKGWGTLQHATRDYLVTRMV